MRIGGRPLRVLLVAISTADFDHPKYSDPSLRHHLHDHQGRRDGVIAKHRVVEGQQAHESTPRRNRFVWSAGARLVTASCRLLPLMFRKCKASTWAGGRNQA